MTSVIADASPEKRLFISLLTRDLSMIAAILDLTDNSINSAVEPYSDQLKTAENYVEVLNNNEIKPSVKIELEMNDKSVVIKDNASGISLVDAQKSVFKFGRSSNHEHHSDRLSVYGIGLKRAFFKLGNRIKIISDHKNGGFSLDLNVSEWEKTKEWSFPITQRKPTNNNTGTIIEILDLYDECKKRINDGIFVGQVTKSISRTYDFYLKKYVNIYVQGSLVSSASIDLGKNRSNKTFIEGDVSCSISAGIGENAKGDTSGWYVVCNGRTVIFADKTTLTGWGIGPSGLPLWQPKHRPFIGIVFFVSESAESLPWTTTKASINEDSLVWQIAKRHMNTVGKPIIKFLDQRYTSDGTNIDPEDLKSAAGDSESALSASLFKESTFNPNVKEKPKTKRICYDAQVKDIEKIRAYLGKSNMLAKEIGIYTFKYYLENEVEDN